MKRFLVILLSLVLIAAFCACDNMDVPADGTNAPEQETTDTGDASGTDETGTPSETDAPVEEIPAFDYMANDLSPYITLGQYEGLTATVEIVTLTDEEYAAQVETLLSDYAYTPYITEERASQEGDNLNVDYAGYIDGEAVDNTAASGDVITITEDSGYIPGFVEGFIGHNVGEEFSFDVTFPEDYGNSSLAGVTVTFKCKINGIYDGTEAYPPTLEEFIAEFTEFETVEEFDEYYRNYLDEQLYYESFSEVYDILWAQIVEGSTYHSLPEEEVERIYNLYRSTYEQYAEMYGVDYETFLAEYLGATDEQLYEMSESYVKEDLTLYQLVKELNVELTEEEFNEGVQYYADSYGVSVEEFLAYYNEDDVRLSLIYEKVLNLIVDSAEVIEN